MLSELHTLTDPPAVTPIWTLTWGNFDSAVEELTYKLSQTKADGIYGEPRGGLILAIALSHSLNLPLISTPRAGLIWVDDIVDSGKTLKSAVKGMTYATWICRGEHDVISASKFNGDEWIVFPWEKTSYAKQDKEQYELSRQ